MRNVAVLCSLLASGLFLSFSATAQQKTVKACEQEWRANKAENQAKGITEKAYVAQCRAGATVTQAPAAPAPSSPTTAAPSAPQASPPARGATTMAPAAAPRTTAQPAPAAAGPMGANQFTTEAQAKARCGTGTVVWANLNSKIYHFAGRKDFGNTKSGAYMCETDATSQGMRAAKNEKHP